MHDDIYTFLFHFKFCDADRLCVGDKLMTAVMSAIKLAVMELLRHRVKVTNRMTIYAEAHRTYCE